MTHLLVWTLGTVDHNEKAGCYGCFVVGQRLDRCITFPNGECTLKLGLKEKSVIVNNINIAIRYFSLYDKNSYSKPAIGLARK